jgi:hypothetical protein
LLFSPPKYLKDLNSVKDEVWRIIAKQKLGSAYDLSPFKGMIEQLLDSISEFNLDWNKKPAVFRIARIVKCGTTTQRYDVSTNNANNISPECLFTYQENIVLPDTKHDLELVIKMLNYLRGQKKLKRTNMPLFIHPDELLLAHKEGKITSPACEIQMQMFIIFQKACITHVGFVFGRQYVILNN